LLFNFFFLYFSLTSRLYAEVWFFVLYLTNNIELELTSVCTIDNNGNVYEGIVDTFDYSGFYLIMLYSKNDNVTVIRVISSEGVIIYGIFKTKPIEIKSYYFSYRIVLDQSSSGLGLYIYLNFISIT